MDSVNLSSTAPQAPEEPVALELPDYMVRYGFRNRDDADPEFVPMDSGMWIASVSVHRLHRELRAEIVRLRAAQPSPGSGADRMAQEIVNLVHQRKIGSRHPAADAMQDYMGERPFFKPTVERSVFDPDSGEGSELPPMERTNYEEERALSRWNKYTLAAWEKGQSGVEIRAGMELAADFECRERQLRAALSGKGGKW